MRRKLLIYRDARTVRTGRIPALRYTPGTWCETASTACLGAHQSCCVVRKVLQLSRQHRRHLVGGKRRVPPDSSVRFNFEPCSSQRSCRDPPYPAGIVSPKLFSLKEEVER